MCKHLLTQTTMIILASALIINNALAQALTDPTRPPGAKTYTSAAGSKRAKSWTLTSTLIANGRRNATINGRLVTTGQFINHAKVVSIHPNEVWLLHKQKRIRIKLLGKDIKDFSQTADK